MLTISESKIFGKLKEYLAYRTKDAEQAAILKVKLLKADALPRVDDIQGYYYARLLPKETFEKMLMLPSNISKLT